MAIENQDAFVEAYISGEPVPIANPYDLSTIEDILVRELLPPTHPRANRFEYLWEMRSPGLHDLLRGKDFSGRLLNLMITDIPNAYDELIEQNKIFRRNDRDEGINSTLGFLATAQLSSTSLKKAGTLLKPVWLMRTLPSRIPARGPWDRFVGKDLEDNMIPELRRRSTQRAARWGGVRPQ
jgi:hypothetical protein